MKTIKPTMHQGIIVPEADIKRFKSWKNPKSGWVVKTIEGHYCHADGFSKAIAHTDEELFAYFLKNYPSTEWSDLLIDKRLRDDNNISLLSPELQTEYNTLIEALEYFEMMCMNATDTRSKKIHMNDLQNTKREYSEFCKIHLKENEG